MIRRIHIRAKLCLVAHTYIRVREEGGRRVLGVRWPDDLVYWRAQVPVRESGFLLFLFSNDEIGEVRKAGKVFA